MASRSPWKSRKVEEMKTRTVVHDVEGSESAHLVVSQEARVVVINTLVFARLGFGSARLGW